MRQFGIRFGGCEEEFEAALKGVAVKFTPFVAVEIGTAGGTTLRAMTDIVRETLGNLPWKVIGTDLPQGWSLDWNETARNFGGNLNLKHFGEAKLTDVIDAPYNVPSFYLIDGRQFVKSNWNQPIHFCFIDGCHGAPCAKADFEAVEPKVPVGGIVVFHDCGEAETGTDWQGHCNQYINVRQALRELGLLDGSRPGWRLVKEIVGSRNFGGDGNSCGVFEKI